MASINDKFGFEVRQAIEDAFGASTMNRNRFKEVVESVDWDERFYADGEHYFVKGGWTLTTPSLDPFEVGRGWRPAFMVGAAVFEF